MHIISHVRKSGKPRSAALSAIVVLSTALAVPLVSPAAAAAQPAASIQAITPYDHSKDKGGPGTHGPLPKGFSHNHLSVKFRAEKAVRLRDGRAVARDNADTAAVQAVLARYPGARISRTSPQSEQAVDAERTRLQATTGRQLPDLNSWYAIEVPTGIESLLSDLNALPSVEIAVARPTAVAPAVDPLRDKQVYRTSAAAGSGIDADFGHSVLGGKGEGITVTDVEAGGRDSAAQAFGSVASGEAHSLMVLKVGTTEFGTVRAWGSNIHGQLGNGNTTGSNVFMQVSGLTNVTAVAAGANFSMALKADGTVWTWGLNSSGQLGNGTTTNSLVPVQVSLPTVRSIAAGSNFAVAVLADGTMRAWGANNNGQLGNGNRTQQLTPVTVTGVTGVSTNPGAVAAGVSHALAVKSTGAVQAWGLNSSGQLGRNPSTTPDSTTALTVSGVSGATQVAAGSAASYVRLSSGAVSSWGANGAGQLGNGSNTNNFTPTTIPGLTSVATVAAGGLSAAVTRSDHSIRTWGLNTSGQLGIGSVGSVNVPTAVNLENGAIQIAVGGTHMTAVRYNPSLPSDSNAQTFIWTWGANGSGQLGTGNTIPSTSPVQAANFRNLWNTCHEDLVNRPAPAGPPVRLQITTGSPCLVHDLHGTASVGFVAAQDDNGVGLNGLLPKARLQLVNGDDWQGSVALARINSQPGDVIWFEVQLGMASGLYPWEWWGPIYDEIVVATAAGVTVVEPGANGGVNLDDPANPDARVIMNRPDSGAILVGAGEPSATMPWTNECRPTDPHPLPRTAMPFSTYGSRVDLQGWGKCIASLGGPHSANEKDLTPSETDPNKMYMSNMNGTSGATPMVVGAVGAVQGVAKQAGAPLTPLQVRALLKQTGTPQPAGDTRHIGPLPDIRAAIDELS